MISMNTGIEAVVSIGPPASPPCPGGEPALKGLPGRSAGPQSASFRQSLRTALDGPPSGSPRPRESASEASSEEVPAEASTDEPALSTESDAPHRLLLTQAFPALIADAAAQASLDERQDEPAAGPAGSDELRDELSTFSDLLNRFSESEGGPGEANMAGNGEVPALLAGLEEAAGTDPVPGAMADLRRDMAARTAALGPNGGPAPTEADHPEALAAGMARLSNSAAQDVEAEGSKPAGAQADVLQKQAAGSAATAGEQPALSTDRIQGGEDSAGQKGGLRTEQAVHAASSNSKTHPSEGSSIRNGLESGCASESRLHPEKPSEDLLGEHAANQGDTRQPADAHAPEQASASPEISTEDGPSAFERFAATAREAHAGDPSTARSGKTAEATGPAGEAEMATGRARSGVFEQIVQRAAVLVKNQSGEIQIDLKPDFLGQVRMQIVTEAQQVSVRILTELPAVRDMIETYFHQLKSELQSQGLQVDRLEVAVADDGRQHPWRRNGSGGHRKAGHGDGIAAVEGAPLSAHLQPLSRGGGAAGIDMFA